MEKKYLIIVGAAAGVATALTLRRLDKASSILRFIDYQISPPYFSYRKVIVALTPCISLSKRVNMS